MGDVAGEVAAVAAAGEGVLHRRIEFHAARRPHAAGGGGGGEGGGGGFRLETLNPDGNRAAAAGFEGMRGGEGRRSENGELGGGGLDPELSVARITFRRIGAGLQNLGNTCYLNSVLQCLTYTEPFAAYLQSGKHKSSCRTAGFCALCAFQSHVRNALQSTGKILTPLYFVKNLRCISRSFRNSRQEDAHELMVNLLESMHKCCLPSGVPSESPSAYEKSLVHKIFGGRLRSQVRCTRCSYCSNKFDPFLDLSLEIAKATTLVRALQNFTEEELLDGGEKQYQCQRCRQKVVAKKKFTIDNPPYVLTIHLKRFSPFNSREKIDKKVDFQPTLDLKPFVSDPQGMDLKYSLYGVLVHAGWNTQSGHYYCFVRTSSGMWHNLDDNQVRQVSETDVLRQKAYMLFYVRDRVKSSAFHKDNIAANVSGKKTVSQQISYLNSAIQNGVMEKKLNGSTLFSFGDMKIQTIGDMKIQTKGNVQFSTLSNTLADQSKLGSCSQNNSNTKVTEATGFQTNSPASLQKALVIHPYGGSALPTKLQQTTSEGHREMPSSGGPDVILVDASNSSNQKATEVSMQELQPKADGVFTHSGKDTPAAPPISNGAGAVLEADDRTSQPRTNAFPKLTSDVNDTRLTAQIIPTKDTIVSGGVICSNGASTSNDEVKKDVAESLKQSNGTVTVKEKDAHDTANAKYQNNTTPEAGLVNLEKQCCSEDSLKKEAVADLSHDHTLKKMDLKSKKFVRYPVMNLCFGPKQLLLSSLKLRKKKKYKRTKKRSILCKDMAKVAYLDDITSDQQTSTSETVVSETVECKSHRRKRSSLSVNSSNDTQTLDNGQDHAGDSIDIGDHKLDKKDSKNAKLSGAELPNLRSCSAASQIDSRYADANARGARQWEFMSFITGGLTEITVPRWDDTDLPNTKTKELQHSRSSGIGYVLDEWDEEYDQGRRKKVRKSKEDFGGPNPFQETLNMRSRQKKKLKADQARSGNQPRG